MRRWFIVPYDGSVVARATLRRAAAVARQVEPRQTGVLLATTGIEPEAFGDLLHEAGAIAGPNVLLWANLLHPGDPLRSLRRLVDTLLDTVLTAPVDPTGSAPWCVAACRLEGLTSATMLFFISPRERRAAEQDTVRCEEQPGRLERVLGRLTKTRSTNRA